MMSDPHQVSRRDFIKGTAAVVGGLIGALIGIPSVAFLLSPAMKSAAETDAVIALGLLDNYPIGVPTRFDFTQTKVSGWSGPLLRPLDEFVTKIEGDELFVQLPPLSENHNYHSRKQ